VSWALECFVNYSFDQANNSSIRYSSIELSTMETTDSDSSEVTIKPEPHPCQVCNKKTLSSCEKCNRALVECNRSNLFTYYCSKECQEQDKPRHKAECQRAYPRLMLFRAGKICHVIFTATRYAAFDAPIALVGTCIEYNPSLRHYETA
jgi:hypothetical protein